jgi:cobalt-precorrin-5B (C1)-methyltransferase
LENKPAPLRSGFTTGTAAAAAVKAALTQIVFGLAPDAVDVLLLTGDRIRIPVHRCASIADGKASATVIKDAGDDPDVTHHAEIGAVVTLIRNAKIAAVRSTAPLPASPRWEEETTGSGADISIQIIGGEGVGQVTLPGLEIPPGEAAINSGPRKMIVQAVHDVLNDSGLNASVTTEIFVPEGQRLAEKTMNARLGILGGISILGTTGIVRPMSHDAYTASIASALSVARAGGCDQVVQTTGRRSERFAQTALPEIPHIGFVQIGDFFKFSLETASQKGFRQITLAVLFGKAVKMAQGFAHTHAAKSDLSLSVLAEWALTVTGNNTFSSHLSQANTARGALGLIMEAHPAMVAEVGRRMLLSARQFAGKNIALQAMIFDYTGQVLYRDES